MSQTFIEYARLVVFLHVVFAVIWVGGMIAIRFAVHDALVSIEDKNVGFGVRIAMLSKFFQMIIVAIVVMGATGIFMMKSIEFSGLLAGIIHLKTQLWTLMVMVFGYIYYKFTRAKSLYEAGDITGCASMMAPIAKYLIPTNIALGLLAVLFGVILRGY